MSIITTDNRYYTEIADAIRNKNGTSNTYRPSEMSTAIEELKDNEILVKIVERDFTSLSAEDLKGITKIGDYAFYCHTSLYEIEIPDSVTSIGSSAFASTGIRNVTIPDSVITIGYNAFSNATAQFGYITIGTNVSYIYDGAFQLNSLDHMYVRCLVPPTLSAETAIDLVREGAKENLTIHVPVGHGEIYKAATNWSAFADNIVDDLTVE